MTVIFLNTGYRNIRVDNLTGATKVTSGLSVADAFKGQNLKSGEKVEVFEKSDLTLALDSDKHVVAQELTKFSLEAFGAEGKDSRTVIRLEKGTISNEIDNKLLPSESYVVESPNASMSVRGTIFTVNVFFDSEGLCHTVVEVEQGVVEFSENSTGNDEVKTLNAGDKAEVVSRVDEKNDDNSSVNSGNSSSGGNNSSGNVTYSPVSDFEYRDLGKIIEITKYIGNDEVMYIPAEIEGKPVMSVGGFSKTNVTSVTIPDSVTEIEDEVFRYCDELTTVEIPDTVTRIGKAAFKQCVKLQSVKIPDGVTYIGSFAFDSCWELDSITIPGSITRIDNYAFRNNMITTLIIENGVQEMGKSAFEACGGLTSIEIPDSVTKIEQDAFLAAKGQLPTKAKPIPMTILPIYTQNNR